MAEFRVVALDPTTWPAFAALVERDGGVWGGCWCMGFHGEGFGDSPAANRAAKQQRVETGRAHAALVLDGDDAVGWCQFGPVAELTRIKRKKPYEAGAGDEPAPDWRITCFYVGKGHRKQGVAAAALGGAVDLIAAAGGGRVESFPELVTDRKVSGSFLHNATVELFDAHGFVRVRPLGKHHWLVVRDVVGASRRRKPR